MHWIKNKLYKVTEKQMESEICTVWSWGQNDNRFSDKITKLIVTYVKINFISKYKIDE